MADKTNKTKREVTREDPDLNFDSSPEANVAVFDARTEEEKANGPGPELNIIQWLSCTKYPKPLRAGFTTAMKVRGDSEVIHTKGDWEVLFEKFLSSPPDEFIKKTTPSQEA